MARERGYLGRNLRGSGRDFDIAVRLGAGAYICGEETSMLESLEGRRGEVRVRPPLPAIKGLFGQPTVVNNVVTLATVPVILARGAAFYRDFGIGKSRGTIPLQLAGNVKRGGLVERAFGLTVQRAGVRLRRRHGQRPAGARRADRRAARRLSTGSPNSTRRSTTRRWRRRMRCSATAASWCSTITVDMARMARYALEFCAIESCGKCTPCRIGSTRGVELIDRIIATRTNAPIHRTRRTSRCSTSCATRCSTVRCAGSAA